MASLPLDTQITILQKEIKELNSKSSKSKVEQSILDSKKRELERLLGKKDKGNAVESKDKSNKTALIIGCSVIGILLILSIFIIARTRKKNRKY